MTLPGGGTGLRILRYGAKSSSRRFFLPGTIRLSPAGVARSCPPLLALTTITVPSRPPAGASVAVMEVTVVQAYILIQTEVGKAAQVAKEVAAIKGVTQAEDVTGPYDVIVRAEARNVDDLGKLVVAKIQAVEGITRTLTCPVVHL